MSRSVKILLLLIGLCQMAQAQLDFRNEYYFRKRAIHETLPLQKNAIVMFGNSLTEQGYWNEYFPGKRIQNRGIGGDVLTGMMDRLQSILDGRPAKIFVMAGINDILFSDISTEKFREMYVQMIQKIMEESPKTRIYIQSLLPVNEKAGKDAAFLKDKNPKIRQFNTVIKSIAEEWALPFIDIYPALEKAGELDERYTFDGVHLNAEGYRIWVYCLKKYI